MSKGRIVGQGPADRMLSSDSLVEQASLVKPQMARLFARLKDRGLPSDVVEVHRAKMLLEDKLLESAKNVPQSA